MIDSGEPKITRLHQQTPEQVADIKNKQILSLIARVKGDENAESVRSTSRARQLKINLGLREIRDLENDLLGLPGTWYDPQAERGDPEYWTTLVYVLEDKYRERDRLQTGRE